MCVRDGRVEKVQDEFTEQIRGWGSLINYLLNCTLKHFDCLKEKKKV